MKINVLPQSIANMIAAGEVVERPASVVKELAENSVDAGAKSITVEIKKGGMAYIRITDDGCGIAPDEVITAFKRHATSKIRTEEDLNAIYTLGFRGEALASIAAVSRVDIFTKTKEESFGYSASIEGGDVTDSGEAGCPDGTTITVRDLFFNTPARMKFLKNDATETSYVTDVVHKMILSHPEISVKLIVNGKTVITSPGDGNVLSAVRAVFGRDYISHMNEISYNEEGIEVTGYAGTNTLARKDRRQQVFFINGRYIKSKIISAALSEAYQNVMMVGKFPVAVISVKLSGSFVDVNVHPTKTEVRFSDDKKIYNAVFWAVKNALDAKKNIPQINITKPDAVSENLKVRKDLAKEKNASVQLDINLLKDTFIKSQAITEKTNTPEPEKIVQVKTEADKTESNKTIVEKLKSNIEDNVFFSRSDMASFKEPPAIMHSTPNATKVDEDAIESPVTPKAEEAKNVPEAVKASAPLAEEIKKEVKTEVTVPKDEEVVKEIQTPPSLAENKPVFKSGVDFAVVGQIFNTYIIVQKDNEMLIIDQHAAHERLYFEELIEEYRTKGIRSQLLLMPVTVDFDPIRFNTVINNTETFSNLGFECEQFGDRSIIVRAVPGTLSDVEIKDTVMDIANLLEKGTGDIKKTLMEDVLHTMACKRAIKGNSKLSFEEMETLVEKVLAFDSINTCPHGRPIITSMTKYELEKSFKRIV